jgi:SAM-dependent methyltransferase
MKRQEISHAQTSSGSCANIDIWESAYLRFETPEQEIRKFVSRFRKLGVNDWPRDARIIDLFCGRGSGLYALGRLGFKNLEGVDLSPTLLAQYKGPGKLRLCDCRKLSFEDASRDIAIVQGGLHHLSQLPEDLERTLAEVHRVLRDDGIFLVVEPWLTPFLRIVHAAARNPLTRRTCSKLDAFQIMIEYEHRTYFQWLNQPELVLRHLGKYFLPEQCRFEWGKLMFRGVKRG